MIAEEESGFSVLVAGLPGCVSQGETREEALENVQEAIRLYLEVLGRPPEGEAASIRVDLDVA